MQLKLKTIASNVSEHTKQEDRTHALTFGSVENPTTSVGIGVFGSNNLVMVVTADEASRYTIGSIYDVTLSLAE